MGKTISIKGHVVPYTPLTLSEDVAQRIDKQVAAKNLRDFKVVLDKHGVSFTLAWGTLLGAFRDGDFIEHDTDIDVAMRNDEDILCCIDDLYAQGFTFCRYVDRLYSFIRDGVYIDVYIIQKLMFPLSIYFDLYADAWFPKKYLKRQQTIAFKGNEYLIPANPERMLQYMYGKTWRTPIANKPGMAEGGILKVLRCFIYWLMPLSLKNRLKTLLK